LNALTTSGTAPRDHGVIAGPGAKPTPPATRGLAISSGSLAFGTPPGCLRVRAVRQAVPGDVVVNEVVTDPQTDWSSNDFSGVPGGGTVSPVDEFVELYIKTGGLDLTGWTIELNDASPGSGDLTSAGAFQVSRYVGAGGFHATVAGAYLVLGNPSGSSSMSNTIHIQDATGGVTVYLGRDNWPPLAVGQPVRLQLGYLRHRSGDLQLYVRNGWHIQAGAADAQRTVPPVPWSVLAGQIGETTESALVTVKGARDPA
jgi:hypothetical protein